MLGLVRCMGIRGGVRAVSIPFKAVRAFVDQVDHGYLRPNVRRCEPGVGGKDGEAVWAGPAFGANGEAEVVAPSRSGSA